MFGSLRCYVTTRFGCCCYSSFCGLLYYTPRLLLRSLGSVTLQLVAGSVIYCVPLYHTRHTRYLVRLLLRSLVSYVLATLRCYPPHITHHVPPHYVTFTYGTFTTPLGYVGLTFVHCPRSHLFTGYVDSGPPYLFDLRLPHPVYVPATHTHTVVPPPPVFTRCGSWLLLLLPTFTMPYTVGCSAVPLHGCTLPGPVIVLHLYLFIYHTALFIPHTFVRLLFIYYVGWLRFSYVPLPLHVRLVLAFTRYCYLPSLLHTPSTLPLHTVYLWLVYVVIYRFILRYRVGSYFTLGRWLLFALADPARTLPQFALHTRSVYFVVVPRLPTFPHGS